MRFQSKKHHIIDILFPISLYFVFTVSALTVLLLATNVYRTTTENSALNFNANTSLSYITEKIHQNDTEGAVSIGSFDGHQALGYGDVSIESPAFDMYRCAGTHRCVLYQHPQ